MLAARGLCKRFGARLVVDDIALDVRRGDVYGFLGPNGAGKTTTLRMLLGLIRPSAGEIELFGERFTPRRRDLLARVGAIVEAPSFYRDLTGRQNLRMLASLTGPCTPARIDEVLELVELRDRADERAGIYSYGMKQRLAIAAALLPRPDLVILDEPTNGLDPLGIRELRALIRQLAAEAGLTIVLSSHLLAEVEQICGRAVIIARGKALWQGDVPALLASRRRLRVEATPVDGAMTVLARFGEVEARDGALWLAGTAAPADVVAALVGAGVAVHAAAPWSPSLEDVFVDLVEARAEQAA